MKLTNMENVDKFFEFVDKCEGKVVMITENGDCLNLKPKLCQFIALAKMLAEGEFEQLEIVVENTNDRQRLKSYMVNG